MKSVVVLSAGLDSAVAMGIALRSGDVRLAVTFDYGQKAAEKEIEYAKKLCEHFGVEHKVIELPWMKQFESGLTKGEVPEVSVEILEKHAEETAKAVWVPNRNMVFIAIAAAFAENYGCDTVVVGFNKEEAETFPDNTKEFVDRINKALELSTMSKVSVYAPLIDKTKKEIVEIGASMQFPFHLTWSCYYSYDKPCMKCESCVRRSEAFKAAGVVDPWMQSG